MERVEQRIILTSFSPFLRDFVLVVNIGTWRMNETRVVLPQRESN